MKRLKLSHPADDLVLTTSETGGKDEDKKMKFSLWTFRLSPHIYFSQADDLVLRTIETGKDEKKKEEEKNEKKKKKKFCLQTFRLSPHIYFSQEKTPSLLHFYFSSVLPIIIALI